VQFQARSLPVPLLFLFCVKGEMDRETYNALPVAKGGLLFSLAEVEVTQHGPIVKSAGGAWYRLAPKLQEAACAAAPFQGRVTGRLGELLAGMAKCDAQSGAKGDVVSPLVTRAASEIADRIVANATDELMDALIHRIASRVRTDQLADQLADQLGDEIAAALPAVLAQRLRLHGGEGKGR
jgi:hypothetical protein